MGDNKLSDKPHRSSPRNQSPARSPLPITTPKIEQKELIKALNFIGEQIKELTGIATKVDKLLEQNTKMLEQVEDNTDNIEQLKKEKVQMRKELAQLKEQIDEQDQYSRKDIVIMTGLEYPTEETPTELESSVLAVLNKISGNRLNLKNRDFVAIHRNRINQHSNRPPTITIKFLRFSDKDKMFTKLARQTLKQAYGHIKLHHGLSPGYIKIRNQIDQHDRVKFVRYEGGTRYFTVCVNGTDSNGDVFYNRIRNLEHLTLEMNK